MTNRRSSPEIVHNSWYLLCDGLGRVCFLLTINGCGVEIPLSSKYIAVNEGRLFQKQVNLL